MIRIFAIVFLAISSPAFAQSDIQGNSQKPIEITATKTVEWLRDQQQYVAREDVVVTQGTMILNTDLLTADYRDGATSSQEIWQLTADGNVEIKNDNTTAYGEKGVYDVQEQIATLTGNNLRLVSPDQTITASERMEYHAAKRMAKAIGNATVTRPKDTLKANIITAFFKEDSAPQNTSDNNSMGGGKLDRLEADGNVVITTPSEILHGNKAVYRADTDTAELIGNVKIKRGPNLLEGNRAEVNLVTNVSKLYGSKEQGGRVRGVFFPGAEKTPDPAPQTPKQAPVQTPMQTPTTEPAISTVPPPVSPAKVSPRVEY